MNPASDKACGPISISTCVPCCVPSSPAAAEMPRLPQQVWNPHSRQAAVRSRQHPDSGPSPRTGIFPRFRQLRASVPISDSEPHKLHVIRASLCDPQRNTCPCPSGRKHSAAFMGLLPWKTCDRKCAPNIPTARRQLPTPQQQAVNPAPNEATNPYPAASGHGFASPTTRHPPAHPGMAPPAADNSIPVRANGIAPGTPRMRSGRPYSRSGQNRYKTNESRPRRIHT